MLGLMCGPYVCAAGSYNPTLKMIYSEEHPLDPATLTAIRTVLSALALLVAVAAKPQQQPQQQQQQQRSANLAAPDEDADSTSPLHRSQDHSQPSGSQAPGQINAAATTAAVTTAAGKLSTAAKAAATTAMATATRFAPLSATFSTVLAAGLELGLYNFAGTSLQAVGVKLLSATRAGFLQQLIVVLTPLLAYLAVSTGGQVHPRPSSAECATADAAQAHVVAVVPMPQRSRLPLPLPCSPNPQGENITPRVWGAVAVGLVGSVAVALDGLPLGGDLLSSLMEGGSDEAQGTLRMLGSCLFYSLSVVRLSMYAPKFCSVDLTAVRKCTLGAASLVWLYSTLQDRFQGAGGEGGQGEQACKEQHHQQQAAR